MTIIYCLQKGAPLTREEADGKIRDLDQRLSALEKNQRVGEGGTEAIASIKLEQDALALKGVSGNSLGKICLPAAGWNPKGEWQSGQPYSKLDLVYLQNSLYLCVAPHTSGEFMGEEWVLVFKAEI